SSHQNKRRKEGMVVLTKIQLINTVAFLNDILRNPARSGFEVGRVRLKLFNRAITGARYAIIIEVETAPPDYGIDSLEFIWPLNADEGQVLVELDGREFFVSILISPIDQERISIDLGGVSLNETVLDDEREPEVRRSIQLL